MGPQIAIYNSKNTSIVSTWELGTLKAQKPSEVLTVNIWNNKGGVNDVSDIKEAYLMVLDSAGDTANGDVAKDKWVQINVPSVDGSSDVWTPIGGTIGKDIRANGGVTENIIRGKANDGNIANSPENVCTVNFKAIAPPNSNPGDKYFRIRITAIYT